MTATFHLSKHHALGNDFLVLLDQPGDAALARRLCHRRKGVGADGLLVGTTSDEPGIDLAMVLFNADGSRAEMSGNGIRCFAHAEARRRGVAGLELRVVTDAGLRVVTVRPGADPARSNTVEASVDMGKALPGPDPAAGATPPDARRSLTVDVGNPHLVLLVDDAKGIDVEALGPGIEAAFAAGINVEWITPVAGSADALDLRVWERGAGHTRACGTGACAAAHAARTWGLVGDQVSVRMEGGTAGVVLGDTITLTGPATFVADVEVPVRSGPGANQ